MNSNPSRIGQINAAGDALAIFLKVFAGEVMAAFEEMNMALPMFLQRNISSGKSAQFPVTWKATAAYHVPGNEIVGQNIKHAEKIINIDALLLSDAFIALIDEAMNHYEVRSIYTKEMGYALANQADKNVLQLAVLAARATSTITGGFGGTQLTQAGYDTTADTLAQGVYDASQTLDEKFVPDFGDRVSFLRPKHYNLLVQSSKSINRDWNEPSGSNGTYAQGKVLRVANVAIKKTMHLPNAVVAALSGANNTYDGDFTNTISAVCYKMAVGTVKLLDMALEHEYDIRRQGTLFVAKYAMGHGILRPECSVELKKA